MLTQGYKESSISVASPPGVMSIWSFKSLLHTDQQRKPQLFFPPQFSIAIFQRFAFFSLLSVFYRSIRELVSWRGFLFSPVLHNKDWIFVLGSSPLILTRKKNKRDCISFTAFSINSSLICISHPFIFPYFLLSHLSELFLNFTSNPLWITRKVWILLKDDPLVNVIISR